MHSWNSTQAVWPFFLLSCSAIKCSGGFHNGAKKSYVGYFKSRTFSWRKKSRWLLILFISKHQDVEAKASGVLGSVIWTLMTLFITPTPYELECVSVLPMGQIWVSLPSLPGSKKSPKAVNFLRTGSGSLWGALGSHLWFWTCLAVSVDNKLSFLSFIGILSNFRKSDKEVRNRTWEK